MEGSRQAERKERRKPDRDGRMATEWKNITKGNHHLMKRYSAGDSHSDLKEQQQQQHDGYLKNEGREEGCKNAIWRITSDWSKLHKDDS